MVETQKSRTNDETNRIEQVTNIEDDPLKRFQRAMNLRRGQTKTMAHLQSPQTCQVEYKSFSAVAMF